MRISWTEKKTNEWVLEKIAVNERLLTTLNRRKMSLIGHILRANDITTDILMEMVYGKRGRGRPKVRYSDNIEETAVGRNIVEIVRMAQDRRNGEPRWLILNPP